LPPAKNSRAPARKSRTADSSDAGVYPDRGGGLGGRQALGQVGAQGLIPAVRRGIRVQEELPAGTGRLKGFR
jgi:hypothetical protein